MRVNKVEFQAILQLWYSPNAKIGEKFNNFRCGGPRENCSGDLYLGEKPAAVSFFKYTIAGFAKYETAWCKLLFYIKYIFHCHGNIRNENIRLKNLFDYLNFMEIVGSNLYFNDYFLGEEE